MKESQQLPWPQNKQLEDDSMLDNLTFSQRRVRTVGVGVLLSAVMLCATPVFAQELRHVAEVMKTTSSGPASFGPVSAVPPLCSATTGGTGCKFLTVTGVGAIGKIVEGDDAGDTFTSTGDVTLLFVPGAIRVGNPLHVAHVSTIITGGTSRFVGLKGGGERAIASGPDRTIEEQVWDALRPRKLGPAPLCPDADKQ